MERLSALKDFHIYTSFRETRPGEIGASEFTHETLEKLDPRELNVRKDLVRAHKLSGDTDARAKKKKR